MHIRARHYVTGDWIDLHCDRGVITSITPAQQTAVAMRAGWVAPALFDLQINGCDGHNFTSEKVNPASVRHIVDVCRRHGIGQLCPTVFTNSFEVLVHSLATLRQACSSDTEVARALPAFHLEGPYISPEDGTRGAHPRRHVRPPDWDEFRHLQDAAGGGIRLVTLAPEHEGAIPFIERLVASGVVVALGHTAANGVQMRAAVAAGARLSTHLGNGCPALLPRHDNPIWEQLATDELWASLICDGHHLPPALIRCFVRVKTPGRIILTSDSSSFAGQPPWRYRDWDQEVEVLSTGKIVLPGTSYLAGSWAFTDTCVGQVMRCAGVSLRDALDMAGARPRELLGLPPRRLEVGKPAELVLFEWEPGGTVQIVRSVT